MQMFVHEYVCIGLSVFLFTATDYVLFLPVGLLFIKKNLLTCIWTQIPVLFLIVNIHNQGASAEIYKSKLAVWE